MAVRVRMFAALREAAGEAETTATPGPLVDVLDELAARYGEPFTARLGLASILVDGSQVPRDRGVHVAAGAELVLLPPVSGGGDARVPAPSTLTRCDG